VFPIFCLKIDNQWIRELRMMSRIVAFRQKYKLENFVRGYSKYVGHLKNNIISRLRIESGTLNAKLCFSVFLSDSSSVSHSLLLQLIPTARE
jgi:hypothetical protein